MADAATALPCLSPLNLKLSPLGRGYSWMGVHLGIASCCFSKNSELA